MSHPEPELLAAYHAGELTEPEERRLQDHLVGCPECAALLLDLDGLSDPGFGAGSLAAADQEALWQSLQSEIRKEEAPVPLAPVVPLRRRALSPPWLPALAAALLAVTIGLSAWVVSLQRKVDSLHHTVQELSQAQPNPAVIQLFPVTTRGKLGSQSMVVPADAPRRLTLLLYIPEPPRGVTRYRATRYRAEVVRGGKVLKELPGLVFQKDLDGVTLEWLRDELGPGDYRLRLFGGTGGGAPEEPVEEYPLHVEPPRGKP
ncbi:MAG TPA: zf-HC2 domain-containing protein [Thermoanaerobaculia bacterium]